MLITNCNDFALLFHFSAGSYCTKCPIPLEKAHALEVVKNGFEDFWNIQKLHENYNQLRKNPNGTVWKSKKGIRLILNASSFNLGKPKNGFYTNIHSMQNCKY